MTLLYCHCLFLLTLLPFSLGDFRDHLLGQMKWTACPPKPCSCSCPDIPTYNYKGKCIPLGEIPLENQCDYVACFKGFHCEPHYPHVKNFNEGVGISCTDGYVPPPPVQPVVATVMSTVLSTLTVNGAPVTVTENKIVTTTVYGQVTGCYKGY